MATLDRNAVIVKAKLTDYLLVPLAKDDKSQFLAQAGYTIENWQQLERDLRANSFTGSNTNSSNSIWTEVCNYRRVEQP